MASAAGACRARALTYTTIVGVELHVQLSSTPLKLFSRSRANAEVSGFDAALPGALPKLNGVAVSLGVLASVVLGCRVRTESPVSWDRKHYSYADLPHGYQVTQERAPLAAGGVVRGATSGGDDDVRIRRVHLEMDTGKTTTPPPPPTTTTTMTTDMRMTPAMTSARRSVGASSSSSSSSVVDLRRAGCALLEVVSEPDMRSGEDAAAFVARVRELLRVGGVSDADMQHGQLRADVNVSVRASSEDGDRDMSSERCEIKNLNSLDRIVRAVRYEQERHRELMSQGLDVPRETRGFDPKTGRTFTLRSKEKLLEYRFLPEPDLPSLVVTDADVAAIVDEYGLEARMERLPEKIEARLMATYGTSAMRDGDGLSQSSARLLSNDTKLLALFEGVMSKLGEVGQDAATTTGAGVGARRVALWLTGPFLGAWRSAAAGNAERGESAAADGGNDIFPAHVRIEQAELLRRIVAGAVSERAAKKDILPELVRREQADIGTGVESLARPMDVDALIARCGVGKGGAGDVHEDDLRSTCAAIIALHPREVDAFLAGRDKLMKFFVGAAMKETRGRADAATASAVFSRILDAERAKRSAPPSTTTGL